MRIFANLISCLYFMVGISILSASYCIANDSNKNLSNITEFFLVKDSLVLDDFLKRYNLAMLIAIRLDSPIENINPNIIFKSGVTYVVLPEITTTIPKKMQTPLGILELSNKANREAYLMLKGDISYGIKTEIYGSMLYIVFAGVNNLATQIVNKNNNVISVAYTQKEAIGDNSPKNSNQKQEENSNPKEEQKDFYFDYSIGTWKYFFVILCMLALLAILYVIRLKQRKIHKISDIKLEQSKILDSKNSISVVLFEGHKYVLGLNPNGITLIDKIEVENDLSNVEKFNIDDKFDFEAQLAKNKKQ